MESEHTVNSEEYWNERFKQNWDKLGGETQTVGFANLAASLYPEWLLKEARDNSFSVCDIGCAEGDALPVLADVFKKSKIFGIDFSEVALQKAKKKYEHFEFIKMDLFNLNSDQKFDITYTSNVLEHFEDYMKIAKNIENITNKYMIILVPFREKAKTPEHQIRFNVDLIPLKLQKSILVYAKTSFAGEQYYSDNQIILIYAKDDVKNPYLSDLIDGVETDYIEKILQNSKQLDSNLLLKTKLSEELNTLLYQKKLECDKYKVLLENKINELEDKTNELEDKTNELEELNTLFYQNRLDCDKYKILLENKSKEYEQLNSELNNLQLEYNNIYNYSYNRDIRLNNILNSKPYSIYTKFMRPFIIIFFKIYKKAIRMFKFLCKLQLRNLANEFIKPLIRVYLNIKAKFVFNSSLNKFKKDITGKRIIIFPPTIDWNVHLFQRPQQLAIAYSKKSNTKVLYITKNLNHDSVSLIEKLNVNLWIGNEFYIKDIFKMLDSSNEVIYSISWTQNKKYVNMINNSKLIYEYIDELNIFHMYDENMEKDHLELASCADITVCTATKLFKQIKNKAKRAIISTNAGDYNFFSKTNEFKTSELISDKIGKYDVVLGYYGALAMWFDYELIVKVASKKTNWLFVLVGLDYDGTLLKSDFSKYNNIVYIKEQPYSKLPEFLKAFDIAVIPFLINEITLSTSPVKLFEYMAAGKPILSSAMPECLKYKSVYTYKNVEDFIQKANMLMYLKDDNKYKDLLKKEALENTWDAKTDEILEALYADT